MISGIYQITNWINNKIYIGSAKNIDKRWTIHKSDLKLKRHGSITLQRAWEKYGKEAFTFHVIEYCEKEKLLEREQYWLDRTHSYSPDLGYNILKIAGSRLGSLHSSETKVKLKIARAKRITKNETRLKISKAHTNRVITQEHRENLSKAAKGKLKSENHKEALKIASRKRWNRIFENAVMHEYK